MVHMRGFGFKKKELHLENARTAAAGLADYTPAAFTAKPWNVS
jgi:hypothetical protein